MSIILTTAALSKLVLFHTWTVTCNRFNIGSRVVWFRGKNGMPPSLRGFGLSPACFIPSRLVDFPCPSAFSRTESEEMSFP